MFKIFLGKIQIMAPIYWDDEKIEKTLEQIDEVMDTIQEKLIEEIAKISKEIQVQFPG